MNWYETQQGASEKEQDNIKKEWDLLKLDLKHIRETEKKLEDALNKAIENGADKDVTMNILKNWQLQHEKANQLEKALFESGEPDIVQDFARQSKENVQKGMHILGEKVQAVNKGVKEGVITAGAKVTELVKQAHYNVSKVFHEKQKELSQKLSKTFENIKESAFNKLDERRLDGWVKAMDIAENYDQKLSENLENISSKKEDMIDKIAKDAFAQKEKNMEKFEKTVDDISKGKPSEVDRIKAGIKQAAEAAMGKEYVNHLSEEKMAEKASDNLKKAKDDLLKADGRAGLTAKAKTTYVKAWAKAQEAKEAIMEKYVSFRATAAEKAVAKIKNPKVMDIKNKIAEVSKDQNISRQEARDSLSKDNATKTASSKMKDMGPVK